MSIAIKVPAMGESVTEATIPRWLKREGEAVKQDEPVVELETDKVNIEVPSPAAGVLQHIEVQQGGTVSVGSVLGQVAEGASAPAEPKPAAKGKEKPKAAAAPQPAPSPQAAPPPPPSVRRIAEESHIDTASIPGTGKHGQVTKADALSAVESRSKAPPAPSVEAPGIRPNAEREQRVPMSRLRRTVAQRLKESQEIAAQLTTFNEADMSRITELRS